MGTKRKSTREDGSLLSVEEAARVLNVPVGQVYRLLERGEIPAVKLGRYWRIPPNVVEILLGGAGNGFNI